MKKLVYGLIGIIFSVVSVYAGAPLAYTLSTNSVQILPERPIYTGAASWTTNKAYGQGSIVQNLGSYYFAMTAGTSSNAGAGPSFRNAIGTDNNITWYPVSRDTRSELCIVNNSSDNVYVSMGIPAITNKGVLLMPSGIPFRVVNYQGQVHAISTNTSSALTVQEW